MKPKITLLLLLLHMVSTRLVAQSTSGNLEGWILNASGEPVSAANVSVTSPDLQGVRGAATDEAGHFRIRVLPPGTYSVRIGHISYRQFVANDVRVLLGQTTMLGEVRLAQRTIEVPEVVVTAQKPVIDTRSTTNGMNLTTEQFAPLPIERSYLHISELLPHANQSFKGDGGTNFAGATGAENKYFIDGADVTDPILGMFGINLPYNLIREVEVRTAGYQAEYQSSLGGIVNSVTRSGGNELHAQVFGFFTNNNFNGAPRYSSGEPPKGRFADYDIGAGLGGPILRDRLWYYFAYDPHAVSEEVPINGLGMQNSHSTTHIFAGKLTWAVDEANRLSLAVCGDPAIGRQVMSGLSGQGLRILNPEACSFDYTNSSLSAILNGTHLLSGAMMLQSSLSMVRRVNSAQSLSSANGTPRFVDYVNGTVSGTFPAGGGTDMRQVRAAIKLSLTVAGHDITSGLEYQENSETLINMSGGLGKEIDRYPKYYETVEGSAGEALLKQRNPSAFLQDSWQLSPALCLNAGIRWDPQWLIASDGSLAQKITDQIQPRFGVIYQPGELGKQKLTASFGRFYEALHLSVSQVYHIKGQLFIVSHYPKDPRLDTSGVRHFPNLTPFVSNVPGVQGQYFDEFAVGYERQISASMKVGVRGIYRRLGQGIEDGVVSPEDQAKYGNFQVYGNPGSGPLSDYPKMTRRYTALELTVEHSALRGFNFLASYTLSRNSGNYDGLAETNDLNGASGVAPNVTNQFGISERMNMSDGLLPNDRTHVFKLFGSYAFEFGLTAGAVLQWMSGTPLNDFGVDPIFGASIFLQPRGSAGRTPSIWDLSIRASYDCSTVLPIGVSTRLILDVLHVASQRKALAFDEYHYFDYEQTAVNPHYLEPVQFQAPMTARLGLEMSF